MESADEQQFCLRWNNFQANITSQFETLRDDEDFTDVTIACDGQKLQAHKVVLSACSPYFKELFKSNPCSHPIIFMRDVEARLVVALMEFMYAGEVNVAQAHLSAFLRTAESLKIRGLTDTTPDLNPRDDDTLFLNPQPSSSKTSTKDAVNLKSRKNQNSAACSSAVTSSQDIGNDQKGPSSPPPKRQCKPQLDGDVQPSQLENSALQRLRQIDESISINQFALGDNQEMEVDTRKTVQPKLELPDYLSDDDGANYFPSSNDLAALTGGMEIIPQNISSNKESALDHSIGSDSRKLHSLDPRPCEECGRVYSNLSNLRQHMKLIHYPTFVSCPICTKSFKTDLYLRRHMITTHETSNYKHTVINANSNRLDSQKYKHTNSCGSHAAVTKAIVSNNSNVVSSYKNAKPNTRSYNFKNC